MSRNRDYIFLCIISLAVCIMDVEARGRLRNPLLQSVYEHHTNPRFDRDQLKDYYRTDKWYSCDLQQFPEHIQHLFVQLTLDETTGAFLDLSYEKSDWYLMQVWHSMAKSFLSWIMTTTSVNGLLGRGSMFVLSNQQFQTLLGVDSIWRAGHLLDLGAGDGAVTEQMADHFQQVSVTEMSSTMQWRLGQKGYRVFNIDEWAGPTHKYDVIAALNLIDRCDRPISILRDIHQSLAPGGMAIIALVLPFKPFVESGSNQNRPTERLDISGKSWEQQAASFIKNVLLPLGFTLHSFTRLPYLCEGDLVQPFYSLDDAVFVVKAAEGGVRESLQHQGWCDAEDEEDRRRGDGLVRAPDMGVVRTDAEENMDLLMGIQNGNEEL